MKTVTFDPAQRLNLIFRIGRAGSKKLIFLNPDETAFDVSAIDLQLKIMNGPQSATNALLLIVGDGLTVGGAGTNELTIDVDGTDTSLSEKIYYWELYNNTSKKTWLNGDAYFIQGKNSQVESATNITIDTGGEIVELTITDGTTTGDGLTDWDMDTNLFPANSSKGQRYYGVITVSTTLLDTQGKPLPSKIIATALKDNASTSDPADWAITYTIN